MDARSTIAWGGVIVGVILFSTPANSIAGTDDAPSAPAVSAPAADNTNSYSAIAGRNAFRLNPPPAVPVPDKGPAPVLPEVYLSGFMRMGGTVKALLVVKTRNPDPRAAELSSYVSLAPGEKVGDVELVRVDAGQEKADIINSGTPMTISTKDNGVKREAPPPAASRPATNTPAMRNVSGAPKRSPKPTDGVRGAGN